jgi:hypothetical protein
MRVQSGVTRSARGTTPRQPVVAALVGLAVVASLAQSAEAQTPDARAVLDFCLANPDNCSLSVHHLTEGWERHWNADRLNVLASTFKVIPLVAYGTAVAGGSLNPHLVLPRDEWARFWVGRDGGALARAWERLGRPTHVEIDQMVRGMMRESDNATPDWLLHRLGAGALQQAIDRYVEGYHDLPKSIAGMFVTYWGNPSQAGIGERVVNTYSGIETLGYKTEADHWFARLSVPAFADAVRRHTCISLPWTIPPSGCVYPPPTSEPVLRRLLDGYFTQSNTRTYTRLMTGLLERTALPGAVQQVVEPHLEWRLAADGVPDLARRFRRYGAKGGDLWSVGPVVLTRTTYLETIDDVPGTDRGTRAAVTIHLRGGTGLLPSLRLSAFAHALVEDPAFVEEVRQRIPDEVPAPDLIGRIRRLTWTGLASGVSLTADLSALNLGTRPTTRRTSIALVMSDDKTLDAGDHVLCHLRVGRINPDGDDRLVCRARGLAMGFGLKTLFLVTDPDDVIDEGDESNNVHWQLAHYVPR